MRSLPRRLAISWLWLALAGSVEAADKPRVPATDPREPPRETYEVLKRNEIDMREIRQRGAESLGRRDPAVEQEIRRRIYEAQKSHDRLKAADDRTYPAAQDDLEQRLLELEGGGERAR